MLPSKSYLVLASQIAITALFALSLELILGYDGIVSLGHAAERIRTERFGPTGGR